MGKKGYVVYRGRKPGVYLTWADCQDQVSGYGGNNFCSYSSMREAEEAWGEYVTRVQVQKQQV